MPADELLRGRCWAEVDLGQIVRNVRCYQERLPGGSEIMAVVKANAYGHGDRAVAEALYRAGLRRFAVATASEGLRLRSAVPEAELLVLGYTPVSAADVLHDARLTQTLLSEEYAAALAGAAREPIDCVYALDTGMRRIGLDADQPEAAERAIRAVPQPLRLVGLMTHLCAADTPDEADSCDFTQDQLKKYDRIAERVRDLDLLRGTVLNSAGGMYARRTGPVRLGIMLYGLKPDRSNTLPADIRPALSWKCRVAQVKTVTAGDTVGYGRTWTADGPRRIATLTVGYADGYSRLNSNRGWVLLHGRRAPVVGRVCMDQTMVDVTEIPEARMGDTAVLLGNDGTMSLTADDMAAWLDTIGYEVVTGISPRVPRIYLNGNTGEDNGTA